MPLRAFRIDIQQEGSSRLSGKATVFFCIFEKKDSREIPEVFQFHRFSEGCSHEAEACSSLPYRGRKNLIRKITDRT